jgi:hypothetical protein
MTGCNSWNCILVPGFTTVVPAVCPYRVCRAVCGGPCGSTLLVFTGTLRPFTETEVNSTLSGSDLRGLARDDVTFPNAFVPALNRTFPLTETSCAIFASKLLPITVCEVIRLTVLTVSTVPAGMVAACKEEAATHPQQVAINAIHLFLIIFIL